MVDVDKGNPLVTLKGRRSDEVVGWCRSRPQEEWARVEVGVLDMSKTYASALKDLFGESVQGIDRFPGVPLAVHALDEVLRSVQKQLATEEAKALKKLRRRWLQSANQLTGDELIARDEWRRRFPPLREMIDWGQDVRRWFERT